MPAKKTSKSRTSPPTKRAARKSTGTRAKSSTKAGRSTPPPRKKRPSKSAKGKRRSPARRKASNSPNNILLKPFYWLYVGIKTLLALIFIKPFVFIKAKTTDWPPTFQWISVFFLAPAVTCFILFLMLWGFYAVRASFIYDKTLVEQMPARTTIYDRNDKVIGHLHGDNRYIVKLENVSKYFIKALVAREDARFYSHGGVDIRGLARSVKVLVTGGGRQGGSTLSMQLADNSFAYKGKTIDGKLLEMVLARKIESDFKKDEILEMYMNRIFWGGSIRGIESASLTYFEKHASELTLGESAMLAGIISGPNAFSPFRHYKRAIKKRDLTLRSMVQFNFITQEQADAAKQEDIHIRPPERRMNKKSYAMSAIKSELDVILEKHNIRMGGLIVKTTLLLKRTFWRNMPLIKFSISSQTLATKCAWSKLHTMILTGA